MSNESHSCECCGFNCYCRYIDPCFEAYESEPSYPIFGTDGNPLVHTDFLFGGITGNNISLHDIWIDKPWPKPITLAVWNPYARAFLGPLNTFDEESAKKGCYPGGGVGFGTYYYSGMDLLAFQTRPGERGYFTGIFESGIFYYCVSVANSQWPTYSQKFFEEFPDGNYPATLYFFKMDKYDRKCRLFVNIITAYNNEMNTDAFLEMRKEKLNNEENWQLLDYMEGGVENAVAGYKTVSINNLTIRTRCFLPSGCALRCNSTYYFSCFDLRRNNGIYDIYCKSEERKFYTKITTVGQAPWVTNPTIYSNVPWCREDHGTNVVFSFTATNNARSVLKDTWGTIGCSCGLYDSAFVQQKFRKIFAQYDCYSVAYYPTAQYYNLGIDYLRCDVCYTESGDPLCVDDACNGLIDVNDTSCCSYVTKLDISPDIDPNAQWCGSRSIDWTCFGLNPYYYGFYYWYTMIGSWFSMDSAPIDWPIDVQAGYTIPGFWTNTKQQTSVVYDLFSQEKINQLTKECNGIIGSIPLGCIYGMYWPGNIIASAPFEYVQGSITYEKIFI